MQHIRRYAARDRSWGDVIGCGWWWSEGKGTQGRAHACWAGILLAILFIFWDTAHGIEGKGTTSAIITVAVRADCRDRGPD